MTKERQQELYRNDPYFHDTVDRLANRMSASGRYSRDYYTGAIELAHLLCLARHLAKQAENTSVSTAAGS